MKELARGFFETADDLYLAGVIHPDDYDAMRIEIGGGTIYVKTGGAGGHYAYVTPLSATQLKVEYSDHDLSRLSALHRFIENSNIGKITEYDESAGKLVFTTNSNVSFYDVGRLLGSLASIDLRDEYSILASSKSIDELINRRIEENEENE